MPDNNLDFMTEFNTEPEEKSHQPPEPVAKTTGVGCAIIAVYAPIAILIMWIFAALPCALSGRSCTLLEGMMPVMPIILLTLSIWIGAGVLISKVYSWLLQRDYTSENLIKRATIIIPLIGIAPYCFFVVYITGFFMVIEWDNPAMWFSMIASIIGGYILYVTTRNSGDDYLAAIEKYQKTDPRKQKPKRGE